MTFAVIGNINVDLVVRPATEVPPPGEEHRVERIESRLGGAAGVAGAVLGRLRAEPVVVGCVGDDVYGTAMLDELGRYGVATRHVRRIAGTATGASIAFEAPARDRSFLIALGSLAEFRASMIPDEALEASFVLLCGYFDLPPLRGRPAEDLLHRVRRMGGTTLLDTGWDHDGWPRSTREEIRRLLPNVDIFLPNADEVLQLGDGTDPAVAAAALSERSGGRTVVKLGRDGCLAVGPNGEALREPAPPVDVVDTIGAGDAFNAGLMWAIGSGEPWPRALRTALRLASAVVARGSEDRYPTAAELGL